jgi:hypothetical protein
MRQGFDTTRVLVNILHKHKIDIVSQKWEEMNQEEDALDLIDEEQPEEVAELTKQRKILVAKIWAKKIEENMETDAHDEHQEKAVSVNTEITEKLNITTQECNTHWQTAKHYNIDEQQLMEEQQEQWHQVGPKRRRTNTTKPRNTQPHRNRSMPNGWTISTLGITHLASKMTATIKITMSQPT